MVKALFDEQTNDTVGIEDEISPGGVLVPDNSVQSFQLRSSTKRKYRWWDVVLFVGCGVIRDDGGGRHNDDGLLDRTGGIQIGDLQEQNRNRG
jgi:hypothetical protein